MRSRSLSCQRLLVIFFCSLFVLAGVMAPASAAMVGTEQLAGAQPAAMDGARVRAALTQALVERGVPREEASQRVAALDDTELAQLAGNIDADPAGGDVLTLAAVIFLVLLWTDIMGYTDVFPFVNKSPNGSQGPIVTEN